MITVFVNKLLLNSETFKLDAPLFVTWSQCVVSTLICYGMGRLSRWQPALVRFPTGNPLCIRTIKNVSLHDPSGLRGYLLIQCDKHVELRLYIYTIYV